MKIVSGEPGEGFTPYGGPREAFYCRDPEWIIEGAADTGKTISVLHRLHVIAAKYPNASIVIARKQQTDIYGTVLQTYQNKVLPEGSPVTVYGGEKPQWFDYPNGSRIWCIGLDKPGKVLSGEHDIIYVNQAEEAALADWETCTTRTTGRAGHYPWPQTIGDCNPAHPGHWIQSRVKLGHLRLIASTHRDNPTIFDQETGELTPEGERRLAPLRKLTGSRYKRLFLGLWAAPEGAIYDIYEEELHKVASFPIPRLWQRAVGIDPAGAYRAALWLAFDPENGVLNVYRELLVPHGSTVDSFAKEMLKLSGYQADGRATVRAEPVQLWVCGAKSERDWRVEFLGSHIPVIPPPISDVWVGIDRVYQLLREGKLVIHDTCPNLLSEIPGYARKEKDGVAVDVIEKKETFHLLDALRYVCVGLTTPAETEEVVSLPWAHIG